MALERMRILDMAHAWSLGTHGQYQTKLNAIRAFEQRFGVSVLSISPLHTPPNGPEVTLSWTQEQYGLRQGKLGTDRVTYGTIRTLRSAASQFFAWDSMVAHPGSTIASDNRILTIPCRPTDDYSGTLLAAGMSARIGNETSPSQPLLARHVHWMDEFHHHQYQQAVSLRDQRELAQAGFAITTFWLGWLRSSELFNRTFSDVKVVEPVDHASADLPPGVGMITISLGMGTKGRRDLCEDVVIAYTSYSGFHLGRWFHRLRRAFQIGNDWRNNQTPIFLHPSGTTWTSQYFRETFLWPSLGEQQRLGDRYLQAFRGDLPGNTIAAKFWSLHCFRRGARSHVSRKRTGMYKKATKDQVYEHARWNRRRQAEAIDVIYRQWTFRDRIELTLYSM